MKGVVATMAAGRLTLHRRNMGKKRIRENDIVTMNFADQISMNRKEHTHRPRKSPMLNMRKWMEANSRGCIPDVEDTEIVIGGKTD